VDARPSPFSLVVNEVAKMKRYEKLLTAVVIAAALMASAYADTEIKPVMMSNRAVGGGQLNEYTPGVAGGIGLNNIGLLVRTWGTVTYVDAVNKFFYIDDGSRLNDMSGIHGAVGLRVSYSGLAPGVTFTPPSVGELVAVTGISSTTAITVGQETRIIPTLKPRRDADKQVFSSEPPP